MRDKSLSYLAGNLWARFRNSRAAILLAVGAITVSIVSLLFASNSPALDMTAGTPAKQVQAPLAQAKPSPALQPKELALTPVKPKDPNAVPQTWQEFLDSPRKDDKTFVASIEKTEWWKNCAAWGTEARRKAPTRKMWALQAKLNASRLVNGIDLGGVRGRVPEIGMTTCGAFAVMGLPDNVNRTKTAASERVQFVWRSPRVYAYTQSSSGDGNALIHSVQY